MDACSLLTLRLLLVRVFRRLQIFMFAVKEVAPSQSKSAFWENDIKVARAIKKGNKKIDLNVIRAGLEDALSKQERAKQGKVLPERRMSARQRSTLTNRKHRHHHHHHHRRSTSPSVVDFNIHSTPSLDESVFEEVMDDAVEPSPLFDDVVSSKKPRSFDVLSRMLD
jgi:hypothetical protein